MVNVKIWLRGLTEFKRFARCISHKDTKSQLNANLLIYIRVNFLIFESFAISFKRET